MSDTEFVAPEVAGILELMVDAEGRLPDDWQTDTFWLSGAQWLAQFIVDHKGIVDTTKLGCLLSIGGQMIAMARAEREADLTVQNFFQGGPADD